MPYKDPERQRAYQRVWAARRRAEWLAGKACIECGSTTDLEVDHLNPADKVSHRIWTWSSERRDTELTKCVVRCRACHSDRHADERISHGVKRYEKGCRCDTCRAAKSAANARHRQNALEAA